MKGLLQVAGVQSVAGTLPVIGCRRIAADDYYIMLKDSDIHPTEGKPKDLWRLMNGLSYEVTL